MLKNPCANKKVFFTISIILVVVSILSMAIRGFNLGIDFTSGTTFEFELPQGYTYSSEMEQALVKIVEDAVPGMNAQVQALETGVFIKASELDNNQTALVKEGILNYFNGTGAAAEVSTEVATDVAVEVETDVLLEMETDAEAAVVENAEQTTEPAKAAVLEDASINIDKVSATTSSRLIGDTFKAVLLALALMLVYIAIRFDFKSGMSAILALSHDVIIMFGFYALFQHTMNTSFIAAVLTIIGYSINATIIVFDRVRENNRTMKASFEEKVDNAIRASYTRTLFSSLTTLFTIGALYVMGVSSIKEFALPIIVGLVAGAYSSLFVAPTFWAWWKTAGTTNTKKK